MNDLLIRGHFAGRMAPLAMSIPYVQPLTDQSKLFLKGSLFLFRKGMVS